VKTSNKSERAGHRSQSLTLIELVTVSLILAIVISLTLPRYAKSIERSKARAVSSALKLIYSAQQRYKLDNGDYFSCTADCQPKEVYDALGITLATNYFTYTIVKTGDAANPGFTATAKRKNEGPCKSQTMTIKNDRGATESEITKGCAIW